MEGQKGFTLVEMLVVVALITLIAIFALPNVSNYFKLSLNSVTRELATTIKEAYNATAVSGRVHRIVYDLSERKFWVESGPTTVLLDTPESREREEEVRRFSSNDAPPPSVFSIEKTITKDKVSLPSGVSFRDIISQQEEEPITEGIVYTHFFPHGVTEQTVIHLRDEQEHEATLVISPIIGQTKLYNRYVDEDEIFKK